MVSFFVWCLRIIGVVIFIPTLFVLSDKGIEYSLKKSLELEIIFQTVSDKVLAYEVEHGSYPSSQKFETWRAEFTNLGIYAKNIEYELNDFSECTKNEFGVPSNSGYALVIWRGEWFECYASWANASTLPKVKSDYYVTGAKSWDFFTGVLATLLLFSSAHFLRSKWRITKP